MGLQPISDATIDQNFRYLEKLLRKDKPVEVKETGTSTTSKTTTTKRSWPVGSVFVSVVATNPAMLLGYGSWTQIAEGQMLVGFKAGDADFGTVEGTGGAKTSTPSAHSGGAVTRAVSGITISDHSKAVDKQGAAAGNVVTTETHTVVEPNTGTGHDHGFTQPSNHAAMSILNPFTTVYVWKRII